MVAAPLNESVLEDQTNSEITPRPTSPPTEPNDDLTYSGKRLRRARPFQRSQFTIDSDETLSSEHWSIYNAEHVQSEENVTIKDEGENGLEWQSTPAILPLSPSLENLSQVAEQPLQSYEPVEETVITSHSGWSLTQLEPIIEQRSFSSLRRSSSLSRIRSRTARPLATIVSELEPQEEWPTDSQRPKYWPWSRLRHCDNRYGHRSFSENDVACMQLPALQEKGQKGIHWINSSSSSSTSQEFRHRFSHCPTFPHRPHRPPPDRVPTPPGIPSFGTSEAVALLAPQALPLRESANHSLQRQQQNMSNSGRRVGSAESQSPEVRSSDISVFFRRSIWNWLRLGNPPSIERTTVSEPRNASLPAGFVPRAEDGTLVRGMFSTRASGHEVGSRPQGVRGIESHPFHSRMSNIAEMIREIDKACEAAENDPVQDKPLRPLQHRLRRSMRADQDVDTQHSEPSPNSDPDNPQLGDESRVQRDRESGGDLSSTRAIASPGCLIDPDDVTSGATSTRAFTSPRRVATLNRPSRTRAMASLNLMMDPSAPSSIRAIVSPRDPRSPTNSMVSTIFSPPFSPQLGGRDLPDTMNGQSLTQRHEADIVHFMNESQRYMAERQREEEKYRGESSSSPDHGKAASLHILHVPIANRLPSLTSPGKDYIRRSLTELDIAEETSKWTRFWHACCLACCEVDFKDKRKRDYHEQQLVVEEQPPGGRDLGVMTYGRVRVF